MEPNFKKIYHVSETVCKALRIYESNNIISNDLRYGYSLLSLCRYISDPISYATDFNAQEFSNHFLSFFEISIHDMQVLLIRIRYILDTILSGMMDISVTESVDFFEKMSKVSVCYQYSKEVKSNCNTV